MKWNWQQPCVRAVVSLMNDPYSRILAAKCIWPTNKVRYVLYQYYKIVPTPLASDFPHDAFDNNSINCICAGAVDRPVYV
jgi:hypothetical protein